MQFLPQSIPEVILLIPRKFSDNRGYFMETYKAANFNEFTGTNVDFVQDNQSVSTHRATVRGLHFQAPPYAQGKLVRCLKGSVLDVAVDLRQNSATYGHHVSALLSEENGHQLWIPPGFGHGFSTQLDDTVISYKCTNYYNPESEGSVLWNDPDLNIDWQLDGQTAKLSEKDAQAPLFTDLKTPFK